MEYIDAIRTARNIKKMSQTEAAEALGVTQMTVFVLWLMKHCE